MRSRSMPIGPLSLAWAGWAVWLAGASLCRGEPAEQTASTARSGKEGDAAASAEFAARTNWWAFKPAIRPAVPQNEFKANQARNPVDEFILAKLMSLQLSPSPEADRRILIRRLTFDLTGLPPTTDEIEAFVKDGDPGAYEKVVDRLLASPRYGERWARHWLDLVHFGETHGYDKDKLRPNAWPYRDYVISAFNQDKPYSRFVEEQLAGDVLYPEDPQGIVALGFIAAGPWDYVGHVELPIAKTDGLIARYNDRDDMVMTTMSTFQSLTVHCARCHNHKFDPITQKDYYRLQAVFAGVDRANRPYDLEVETHRRRRALMTEQRSLARQQERLQSTITNLTCPELKGLDEQLARLRSGPESPVRRSPGNGYHSHLEAKPDSTKWVQLDFVRPLNLEAIRLVPARPTDFADTPGFGFPVRFRVELADEPGFTNAQVLVDHTTVDFSNPGDRPVVLEAAGKSARCVRVTATRLWERTQDYGYVVCQRECGDIFIFSFSVE